MNSDKGTLSANILEETMTYPEIEAFLSIVQCGSFSGAADQLFITQPAMGRRIKALEEELGYPLFLRSKGVRRVELTSQGRAFIPLAQRWQELWKETQEASLLDSEKNFSVGSIGSLLAFLLPSVFNNFMKVNPDCRLHVTTLHSVDAYEYVRNSKVDIAFVSDPIYSTKVSTHALFREKLCLVAGNSLELPSSLTVSDLDPRLEIRTEWDREFNNWHDYYFGSRSTPHIQLDEMGFLQYFLELGNAWAFLPESIARSITQSSPLSIHHLDVVPPSRTIYYLFQPMKISDYQEKLLMLCRDHLEAFPGVTVVPKDESDVEI